MKNRNKLLTCNDRKQYPANFCRFTSNTLHTLCVNPWMCFAFFSIFIKHSVNMVKCNILLVLEIIYTSHPYASISFFCDSRH